MMTFHKSDRRFAVRKASGGRASIRIIDRRSSTTMPCPISAMTLSVAASAAKAGPHEIRHLRPHRRRGRAARPALRRPADHRRGLRPRGLLRLSRRRASHDAARRRGLAGADLRGAVAAHQETAVRAAGLSAAVLSSAPPDRRGLHDRSVERRALPARRRPRRLDVRDRGLWPRLRQDPGDVSRGVPGAAQGPDLGRAVVSTASSTSSTSCR